MFYSLVWGGKLWRAQTRPRVHHQHTIANDDAPNQGLTWILYPACFLMKKLMTTRFGFVSLVVFAIIGCSQSVKLETPTLDPRLRTDGIYQSDSFEDHGIHGKSHHFLRFHDDSVVIAMSSIGRPEKIKTWFKKGREKNVSGIVATRGDTIEFTTSSPEGEVDYNCSLNGNRLTVTSVSRIPGSNGVGHTSAYSFHCDHDDPKTLKPD